MYELTIPIKGFLISSSVCPKALNNERWGACCIPFLTASLLISIIPLLFKNIPLIGIVSSYNEIVPGHMNLDKIVEAVKLGVAMAGGTPVVFPAIAVCDGIEWDILE